MQRKKADFFFFFFLIFSFPLRKSLSYGMLCMTSSTSVHLDRSCGDLAHRCLYLLDKQSRIFCKDYPSLLRSEVFSCLPAQTTKINPLQRGSVIAAEAALARPSPKWSNKKVCIPYRNQRRLVWTGLVWAIETQYLQIHQVRDSQSSWCRGEAEERNTF